MLAEVAPIFKTRMRERINASPVATRLARRRGIELSGLTGSGPNGRIVQADLERLAMETVAILERTPAPTEASADRELPTQQHPSGIPDIPHELVKPPNMRKTIARRLTESKQQIPHIYLAVDIRLDPLLKLRRELNEALAHRGAELSVNDLLIKAFALALVEVPKCNVMLHGDQLISFNRVDISVAVSMSNGLIAPVVISADSKSLSVIAAETKGFDERARDGKLMPEEYAGGTASLANMGMFGIKQFDAVINPPQCMILAIGAGDKRPYVIDDALTVSTVMTATGSFDHRAIDGADGAALMQAFKRLIEHPIATLA